METAYRRPADRRHGPAPPLIGAGGDGLEGLARRHGRLPNCSAAPGDACIAAGASAVMSLGDGGVDGLAAEVHVVSAVPVPGQQNFGSRRSERFRRAAVEDRELAAASAAGGQALQQRAAFMDCPVPGCRTCGRMFEPIRAWVTR